MLQKGQKGNFLSDYDKYDAIYSYMNSTKRFGWWWSPISSQKERVFNAMCDDMSKYIDVLSE